MDSDWLATMGGDGAAFQPSVGFVLFPPLLETRRPQYSMGDNLYAAVPATLLVRVDIRND